MRRPDDFAKDPRALMRAGFLGNAYAETGGIFTLPPLPDPPKNALPQKGTYTSVSRHRGTRCAPSTTTVN
jgi:hypothetical protein